MVKQGRGKIGLFALLALALAVVSLVPLLISDWALISRNRESLETLEQKYLTRSAVGIADKISSFYRAVQEQLRNLSDAMLYSQTLSGRDPFGTAAETGFLQDFLKRRTAFLAIRVVDRRGRGGAFGPEKLPEAVEKEFGNGFIKGIAGQSYSGDPVRAAGLPAPVAVLAVPVQDDVGETLGVVEGLVSWEPVLREFQEEARHDVRTFLVDRSGRLLLSVDASEEGVSESSLVTDFRRYPARLTRSYQSSGKRLLGSIAPVGEPDWGVLVERDERAAFASVDIMVRETAVWSVGALLLAILVGVLFARAISRPIRALAESAHAVAEGEYGRQVAVQGTSEIAGLATTFNRMSLSIQGAVEGLQRAARENHELFLNSVRALAAAIDAKDPYTRGHSERVAVYAGVIAKQMGLSQEEMRKIRLSALLHDVGKIGIDDRILRKPTALTDEEFEIMKTHPVKGATIMSAIPQLADVIPGMRHHHEKWEGGGYPDGLNGDQIPLMARVITVADTFDAMTTTRPYQKAMETSYVVKRIESFGGTRFDLRVVNAFVQAFEAGEIIPRKEAAPASVKTVA